METFWLKTKLARFYIKYLDSTLKRKRGKRAFLIARFSRDHCNLYLFAVFDCFDCSPVTFSLFYFNMLKNFWIHIYSNNIDFTAVYNEFYFKIFTKIFFNIHQNLLLNSLKFTSIFTKIYFNIHFKLFHSYFSRSCNKFTSLLVLILG